MLHMPSYNLGLSAGIAWRHASPDSIDPPKMMSQDTPDGQMMLEVLRERLPDDMMFMPSSYREGFGDAWRLSPKRKFIDCNPVVEAGLS